MGTMSQRSAGEIHLPQSLNKEASADEFSEWEQVSSMAAELFAPTQLSPPVLSHTSPSPFYPPSIPDFLNTDIANPPLSVI